MKEMEKKDQKTLYTELKAYGEKGRIPFHMPGHKRSLGYGYLNGLGAEMDITEIDGFDNLHDPSGILAEGMGLLSFVYGSKRSFYLINGSTGGLLAAVRCAVPFGRKVLMARNCHKAVYNAVELVGARPVYLDPPRDGTFGFCLDVLCSDLENVLDSNRDASAVIVTSPTYDGVVSDIAALAEACHRRGIPLIVDEAHGAHLGFLDQSIPSAVRAGADVIIQSFHKTMPSLTQTAVAHVCGDLIDPAHFAAELSVFETSSPSYLLMASLDGCVRFLADAGEREEFFRRWKEVIGYAEEVLSEITGIRIFGRNARPDCGIYGYDRSKFAVFACGLTGPELAEILRRNNMEPEMVAAGYVLLMTGADTSKEEIDRLARALSEGVSEAKGANAAWNGAKLPLPCRIAKMTPFEVRCRAKETVSLAAVEEGAVSGDYVFAYPPGIPVVVPGEVITAEVKEALFEILRLGLNPATLRGAFEGEISVVRDTFVGKMY